jgi:hypothetical protein
MGARSDPAKNSPYFAAMYRYNRIIIWTRSDFLDFQIEASAKATDTTREQSSSSCTSAFLLRFLAKTRWRREI